MCVEMRSKKIFKLSLNWYIHVYIGNYVIYIYMLILSHMGRSHTLLPANDIQNYECKDQNKGPVQVWKWRVCVYGNEIIKDIVTKPICTHVHGELCHICSYNSVSGKCPLTGKRPYNCFGCWDGKRPLPGKHPGNVSQDNTASVHQISRNTKL